MPEPSAFPQPKRHGRFWLWAPYVLVLVGLIVWSGVWWSMKLGIESALDTQAKALRARGDQASWTAMKIDGWPFRLDLTLTGPRFAEPSGWGLAAPILKAESLPYAPDHWIFVADQGLTWIRPGKGPLSVSGRAIRTSVGGWGSDRPRFSFEGLDLIMAPAPGGQPAAFSSADRLELHLQPGPDNQGALLIRLEKARLDPSANLARVAPMLDLTWDARLSYLSALRGQTWPSAVRNWTAAGGAMTVVDAKLGLGGLELHGAGGLLTVDADGRLQGTEPLTVGKGGGVNLGGIHLGGLNIGGLSFSGSMPLTFENGRAGFGGFPIGPALKIY